MQQPQPIQGGPWEEIPLSALEHHEYCPRQAAIIHVEGIFTDNVYTVHGHAAHDAVHPGATTSQDRHSGTRALAGIPVKSAALGLFGYCDIVEFTGNQAVPVEHKSGRYQPDGPPDVQVAAQAICLREGGYTVPHGVVFSYKTRTRHVIELAPSLLLRVEQTVVEIRHGWARNPLPAPISNSRCRRCSLLDDCLPFAAEAVVSSHHRLFIPGNLGDFDA